MPPSDVQQALAQVISDMLAENRFYFGPAAQVISGWRSATSPPMARSSIWH